MDPIDMGGALLVAPLSEERVGRPLTRITSLTQPTKDGVNGISAFDTTDAEALLRPDSACEMSPLMLPHHRKIMESAGTKPIAIPGSPSRSRSRARHHNLDLSELHGDVPPALSGRARRRKKKALKKQQANTALINQDSDATPSGGEDSDFQASYFKRIDISARASVTSSPMLNATGSSTPVIGGISALRRQLSTMDLGAPAAEVPAGVQMVRMESMQSVTSQSTVASGSGSDKDQPRMMNYEVRLEHDFVSTEAQNEIAEQAEEANGMPDNVHRKMTAEDFESICCLGKGTFGTVHMVRQKATGRLYAQKMFRKASLTVRKALVEQTKTERAILESVNRHPFVVKLFYAFQDNERLYLILEYAQGGELFHHLHREGMFSEAVASFYMAELVLALEHLHGTVGVIYRDLKPENCLLDAEGHLLLTDFGLSKVSLDDETDRSNSFLGTLEYMAPEVITGQMYGRAVDWWSLGALGCDLLTGNPPFTANNRAKIQEKVVKAKLQLPYYLGPDAKDLLTRLLRKEPARRLGAKMPRDMALIKGHRFFRQLDWRLLERRALVPPIRPLVTDPLLAENFDDEFTALALSPPDRRCEWDRRDDTFGGFSFVASPTLLKGELW